MCFYTAEVLNYIYKLLVTSKYCMTIRSIISQIHLLRTLVKGLKSKYRRCKVLHIKLYFKAEFLTRACCDKF